MWNPGELSDNGQSNPIDPLIVEKNSVPEFQEVLDIAVRAAEIGGEHLMEFFEKTSSSVKLQSYNLVTEADLASEKAIAGFIRENFPSHEILGEESADSGPIADPHQHEHLWVIDPLDGTNNFVHGIPHFAVSIAYAQSGVPKVAVVLNPFTGEQFHASSDSRSQRNGKEITVSEADSLGESIVGVGFYYDRDKTMKPTLNAIEAMFSHGIHGIRRMGTASLDLCYVACGRFGAYFEYELAPWDFAAGWLIVEQAGGIATQCNGSPLTLRNQSMLASNKRLHPIAVNITNSHFPNTSSAN